MQRVDQSIRVSAPIEQVYQFWRNFENFPRFMEHVEEVRPLDAEGRQSHWRLKGPIGTPVEFDAVLTEDVPPSVISWNSTGGTLNLCGGVTFTPVNDETLVHVLMEWSDPPGGPIGQALSRILQNPEQMLAEDLQRFKGLVEERAAAGEPAPPTPDLPDSHAAVSSN